ncbi:MAG: TldD/PmbA family protein [Rickettsiales bacterium]|jgi:PmbA protein|nr:TldD/PmbA family protein [Rickettsiales bacterium]
MSSSLDTLASALAAAKRLGATACDAVLFESTDISHSCRLGKPEGLERSESKALGLRAFVGMQQAIVSTTDLSPAALGEAAERAVAMAKLAPADPDAGLADPSLYPKAIPSLDLYDAEEPAANWFIERCKEAEDAALGITGVMNSEGAEAHYNASRISLAIAKESDLDFAQSYPSSHLSLSVSVLAGSGTEMERDYDYSSTRHRADLSLPQAIGKEAGERAVRRLNPRKVTTCEVPVVFDPRVGKQLVGILASAASGASVVRGASFLKDSLGKVIASKNISIIDDPHLPRGLGSKPFDGEAVAGKKLALVQNGVLASWLLDIRSASKLEMKTTGHASRGIASAPSPSSTNLYMENGTISPAELIADIQSGLYLTETFGMGVNLVTGDYSQGAAGFWIERGEIAYPVSEITIAGRLQDMLMGLSPANDLAFRYATNAPTFFIPRMTIAGA